jgi:DNA-binding transcriptional MerR regulator
MAFGDPGKKRRGAVSLPPPPSREDSAPGAVATPPPLPCGSTFPYSLWEQLPFSLWERFAIAISGRRNRDCKSLPLAQSMLSWTRPHPPLQSCTPSVRVVHLDDDDLYRIGTIATLTGIAVERLRAWERRYGLAPAVRSGRTRYYSRAQLEQLTRIKQLIDQGHPIGSIAGLTPEQLNLRVTVRPEASGKHTPRTGLIGPNLLVLELAQSEKKGLDVRSRWANLDAFLAARGTAETLDALVVQMPVLLAHRLDAIAAAQPRARLVALYQFATPKHLAAVQERGIPTLAWPCSWQDIEHACTSTAGLPLRAGRAAERRFTDDELVAIAGSSTDAYQCPQHLVQLVSSLNAFAEYAANCAESVPPERGALYEQVQIGTTQARAQLELALAVLVDAEEPDAGT